MKPGFDLGGGGGGGGEEEENDSLSSLNLLDDGNGLLDDDVHFNSNNDGNESEDATAATTTAQSSNSGVKRKLKYNYSNRKRKCRTTFTKGQLNVLEAEFVKSNFVSNDKIDSIVEQTGLDSRIIKNWFKNKRSRVLADSKQPSGMNGVAKITQQSAIQLQQQPQQQQLLNITQPTTTTTTINLIKYSPNGSTPPTPPTINMISPHKPPVVELLEQPSVHYQHYHHHQIVNHSSAATSSQTTHHMTTMTHNTVSPVSSAPASLCLKINTEIKPDHQFTHPTLSTEINGYHQYQQKPVQQQCQQQQQHRINKNLNGLLDIVNSIKTDSKTTTNGSVLTTKPSSQPQPQSSATMTITNRPVAQSQPEQCQNCAKFLCTCNISRSTLARLYRNFAGFNSIEKQPHHHHNQYYNGNDNYQVVRRAVCHPTKQWAEQHKDFYSFFDANETEKIFFVL